MSLICSMKIHATPNLKEVFKRMTIGKDRGVRIEALVPQVPPFGTKAEITNRRNRTKHTRTR